MDVALHPVQMMEAMKEVELLSLILGEGGAADEPRAKALLQRFGDLHGLRKILPEDLAAFDAGDAKRLMACMELTWRLSQAPWKSGEQFCSSEQVFRAFRSTLGRERVEVAWVLLLDARLRKIDAMEISRGMVTGALVHPREVLRPVVLRQAPAFLLLHNHPSGDPQPSTADIDLTRKVARAARLFDIDMLDHLIITPGAFYSFADHRMLG